MVKGPLTDLSLALDPSPPPVPHHRSPTLPTPILIFGLHARQHCHHRVLRSLELSHLGLQAFQLSNSLLHSRQALFHYRKLFFEDLPDRLSMHRLPLSKFCGQVLPGSGTGILIPFQALVNDLACTNRLLLHSVDLGLNFLHAVRY